MRFAAYADGKTIQCSQPVPAIAPAQIKLHCYAREKHGTRERVLAKSAPGLTADLNQTRLSLPRTRIA